MSNSYKGMISEILRQVSALGNTDDATCEWVILWAQMAQKVLDNVKEATDSDFIG